MDDGELTYVDLFAGAGGLSVGLENAGFELLHAVEIDEDARSTFAKNREGWEPGHLSRDMRSIDIDDITGLVNGHDVDLVAGGPPCQGFSEVVSPDGSDDRNHLFEYFIDWVNELHPKVALFENVRGMQKTAGGKFLDAVEKSFDNMGYQTTPRVVEAAQFGVPQLRRRLIVVATREDVNGQPFDGFELDPITIPGVMDGIGDLPEVGPGQKVTEYTKPPETVLQDDLRQDSQELTIHQAASHSDEMVEMISHISDGGNRKEIPDHLQPSSGYHNSYSRLKSDEPAVAITSNMSKPSSARCIHPFQHRGLTPREGARLQTFPDSYEFEGGLVSIRRQIGNAVPPYLGESIGYYLKQGIFGRTLSEEDGYRIFKMRSGGLDLDEFEEKDENVGGHAQQVTLDNLT